MSNKQEGLLQLTGSTQKMIFFRKKNGEFGLKRKGGVTSERFRNDPNFEQVRLNTQDFAKAGKAGKLIKRAFGTITPKQANSTLFPRLTKACKAVIKSDLEHERGQRTLLAGDTNLLVNFNFTEAGNFDSIWLVPISHSIDRVAGTVGISLPAFIPAEMVVSPDKATHVKLRMGAAAIDFETGEHAFSEAGASEIVLGKTTTGPVELSAQIPQGTTDPVFIAIVIEFMEQEGNIMYPILNSRFLLMKMVAVDVPA